MCVTSTTKSTGFAAASGFIAAAHGGGPPAPPLLRSSSVHVGMGTRSLATKRRAAEAIKVRVFFNGSKIDWPFFSLFLFNLDLLRPSPRKKPGGKKQQAVALGAEAPAPLDSEPLFSSPARKVAIFVGE